MADIFKLKTRLLTPLIKLVVKHPGIMESKLFLKLMAVFPEKISSSYDLKVEKSGIDYKVSIGEKYKLMA